MPINRFYKLRQDIHFVNDLEDQNETDRFWKVRQLYNAIRSQLFSLPLESQLSIDKQMVPFKGSLNVKQYVKNKTKAMGNKAICTMCY